MKSAVQSLADDVRHLTAQIPRAPVERGPRAKSATASASARQRWSDPLEKARMVAILKARAQTPEGRAHLVRMRSLSPGHLLTPEERKLGNAALRQCWADPAFRAAMVAKKKAWAQSPEGRAQLKRLHERNRKPKLS